MDGYRWTTRIAMAGVGFLAVIVAFVTGVLVLGTPILGVQPEAFALIAMMTAPFTVGPVLVSVAAAALTETFWRMKRPTGA